MVLRTRDGAFVRGGGGVRVTRAPCPIDSYILFPAFHEVAPSFLPRVPVHPREKSDHVSKKTLARDGGMRTSRACVFR